MHDQDGEPTDKDQENGGDHQTVSGRWKPRGIQETHPRGKREVPVQLTDELQSAPDNLSGLLLMIAASL